MFVGRWRKLAKYRGKTRRRLLRAIIVTGKWDMRRAWTALSDNVMAWRHMWAYASRTVLSWRTRRYFQQWRSSAHRARGTRAILAQLRRRRGQVRLASYFRRWHDAKREAERHRGLLQEAQDHHNAHHLRIAFSVIVAYTMDRLRKISHYNVASAWSRHQMHSPFTHWRLLWLSRIRGRVLEEQKRRWGKIRGWHRWQFAYRKAVERRDVCISRHNDALRRAVTAWRRSAVGRTRAKISGDCARAIAASRVRRGAWSLWKGRASSALHTRALLVQFLERRQRYLIKQYIDKWRVGVLEQQMCRCRRDVVGRTLRLSCVRAVSAAFARWLIVTAEDRALVASHNVAAMHWRGHILRRCIRDWRSSCIFRRVQLRVAVTYSRQLRLERVVFAIFREVADARRLRRRGEFAADCLAQNCRARFFSQWQHALATATEQNSQHQRAKSCIWRRRASRAFSRLRDAAVVEGSRRERASLLLQRSFEMRRCRMFLERLRRRTTLRRVASEVSRRARMYVRCLRWGQWHDRFVFDARRRGVFSKVAKRNAKRRTRDGFVLWRRAFMLMRRHRAHVYIAFLHFSNVVVRRSFRLWHGRAASFRRLRSRKAAIRRFAACFAVDQWRASASYAVAGNAAVTALQQDAMVMPSFYVSVFRWRHEHLSLSAGTDMCVATYFLAWRKSAILRQRLHAQRAARLHVSSWKHAAQARQRSTFPRFHAVGFFSPC